MVFPLNPPLIPRGLPNFEANRDSQFALESVPSSPYCRLSRADPGCWFCVGWQSGDDPCIQRWYVHGSRCHESRYLEVSWNGSTSQNNPKHPFIDGFSIINPSIFYFGVPPFRWNLHVLRELNIQKWTDSPVHVLCPIPVPYSQRGLL